MEKNSISVVIPAKNEALSLENLILDLKIRFPEAEIIVVDDGSSDDTSAIALKLEVKVIIHPYSKGNGSAIKSGIRAASGDVVVCMDADGQHRPEDIHLLLEKLNKGYDMVVGSRDRRGQAGAGRSLANGFYNKFASWMVGHPVLDLTSGFRVVRASKFKEFISLLPNKFSYPTTITMSFFRAGYSVAYVPVDVQRRCVGSESHIHLVRDGIRFLLIIFKIGTLFSPLKLFLPVSLLFFFYCCWILSFHVPNIRTFHQYVCTIVYDFGARVFNGAYFGANYLIDLQREVGCHWNG